MRSLANMVPGGQWAHKRKKVDFKKETMHHRLDSVDNSLDLCVCVLLMHWCLKPFGRWKGSSKTHHRTYKIMACIHVFHISVYEVVQNRSAQEISLHPHKRTHTCIYTEKAVVTVMEFEVGLLLKPNGSCIVIP